MSIVFISEDGTTKGVASPLTALLSLTERKRVSHVEPVNPVLRRLFHFIRSRVTDTSLLANSTRHWPCRWQAAIVNGPVLGPFWRRGAAITAEIGWINKRLEENTWKI